MDKLLAQKFWTEQIPWHFEFRNPQPPYPMHSHNFYELAIVYSGKGTHSTPTNSRTIQTGEVIIVKPGQVHAYTNVDHLVLMNVMIRPDFFDDDAIGLSNIPHFTELFQTSRTVVPEKTPISIFRMNNVQLFEVRALLESMQDEVTLMPMAWNIASTTYLVQLLVLLLRIYNDPGYPDSLNKNHAAALVKYIEKNFKKHITMQDLMEYSHMSESTVLRTLKRITGYPPFEYQMRQRMFAAVDELVATERDITQIAYDVGFNDSNYFSRCFKKFMNMSPREYRQFTRTGQPTDQLLP